MDQPVAFSTNLVTASAANTMVRWASMGFQDAHAFCGRFFRWYNDEHRHSGIGLHTPADVHYGRAELVRARRGEVLSAAYTQHPERFVRKPPAPPALPKAVWINQPKEATATTQCSPTGLPQKG
jgi:hypothetical protein